MTVHRSSDKRAEHSRPRRDKSPAGRPAASGGRIEQVRQVLDEVVTWQFAADSVVSHWLRAHPAMGVRDRGEVAEAVYDILRHLRRYRQFAESGVGPATRRLAILGLWSTLGRERIESALDAGEQAWLDRVLQIDSTSLSLPVRSSTPDWLFDRVKDLPNVESLLTALNQPASLDIRVNPMKADRDEMVADLARGNGVRWSPVATPYSPWGIRLRGRPAMNKWHQFEHGLIEVQDEGSQLLALLVAPRRGEMVIDFCAGAGGKTLLLGALMRSTGRLYAFDVSAARLARAKPRFARSGLSNINPVAIEHENDARVRRLAGKAQRVLVDAPCSGIGTLRRNPDLKWRQNQQSLVELTALQARILSSAARCVAPGGRLVYATCSILPEENEAQVEQFLATHPEFELVSAAPILAARTPLQIDGPYLKLRPDVHGTDGFFAAVMDRVRKVAKPVAAHDAQTIHAPDDATKLHAPEDAVDLAMDDGAAAAGGENDAMSEAKSIAAADVVACIEPAEPLEAVEPVQPFDSVGRRVKAGTAGDSDAVDNSEPVQNSAAINNPETAGNAETIDMARPVATDVKPTAATPSARAARLKEARANKHAQEPRSAKKSATGKESGSATSSGLTQASGSAMDVAPTSESGSVTECVPAKNTTPGESAAAAAEPATRVTPVPPKATKRFRIAGEAKPAVPPKPARKRATPAATPKGEPSGSQD